MPEGRPPVQRPALAGSGSAGTRRDLGDAGKGERTGDSSKTDGQAALQTGERVAFAVLAVGEEIAAAAPTSLEQHLHLASPLP